MSVKAVTPSDAAKSPAHPDHSRWVKDITLKREVEHATMTGGSSRDAETANLANLERLDGRKRHAKPQKPKKKVDAAKREVTHADLIAAGVTKKPATIRKVEARACNFCGLCKRCRRELRVSQIMAKAREGDRRAHRLTMELVAVMFAAQRRVDYKDEIGRELPFSRLHGLARDRAATAGVENVCDRSTSFMGEWRK